MSVTSLERHPPRKLTRPGLLIWKQVEITVSILHWEIKSSSFIIFQCGLRNLGFVRIIPACNKGKMKMILSCERLSDYVRYSLPKASAKLFNSYQASSLWPIEETRRILIDVQIRNLEGWLNVIYQLGIIGWYSHIVLKRVFRKQNLPLSFETSVGQI